ncbi:hypothetical protein IFR09_03550 [Pseudomonas syringae]|nr:hypothetical protein [Pseudomonas syringae]MBD8573976.1 hypothetical protein [Pseudomonas syringae]MBD8791379.1 hypothetical protein [Pseudomonas syringae]MBD8801487.1 hypothetical protein [Pseudomonas syringae]MBD8810236.1 hypothetical protein [Pseudomonas syringae]
MNTVPIRPSCPPGACDCGREQLQVPGADPRVLLLTREQENRLIERLENIETLAQLQHLQQRLFEQLGVRVHVAPGFNEVKTMRGIHIQLDPVPGLCRKTRASIPAAIRRGLEKRPQIAWDLLNTFDLLRDA